MDKASERKNGGGDGDGGGSGLSPPLSPSAGTRARSVSSAQRLKTGVDSFRPTFGSEEGGFRICIKGRGLGSTMQDIKEIQIAGSTADLATMEWISPSLLTIGIPRQIPPSPLPQHKRASFAYPNLRQSCSPAA